MPETQISKVSAADVPVNRRRGGEIRVLLSPKTTGATSGFMGVARLAPDEGVTEHRHPYSEEFMYVVRGQVVALIEGDQEISLGAGDGLMVPTNMRHKLRNAGQEPAFLVFHASPLAPRPELGHVDTEPSPATADLPSGAAR